MDPTQKDLTFFLGSGAVAIGYEFVAAHFYGKSAAGDRALMGGSALTHGAATYFSYKFLTNPNTTELGKVLSYIFGAVTGIVAVGSLVSMFAPGKPLPPSVIRSVTRAIGAAGKND